MDRFSTGLADPQEETVVDECDECGGEIYRGQMVWRVGADLYCKKDCLLQNIGAVVITAGEE